MMPFTGGELFDDELEVRSGNAFVCATQGTNAGVNNVNFLLLNPGASGRLIVVRKIIIFDILTVAGGNANFEITMSGVADPGVADISNQITNRRFNTGGLTSIAKAEFDANSTFTVAGGAFIGWGIANPNATSCPPAIFDSKFILVPGTYVCIEAGPAGNPKFACCVYWSETPN